MVGLLSCLLVGGGSGCNHSSPSWLPFSNPPEHLAGVPAPSERIANLRKLAEAAPKTEPAPRELVAQDLARELQKEDDPILRAEILRALAAYGGPAADAMLRAALNDPDASVRDVVCTAWGKKGDAAAAKLLSGVLNGDIDKDVRMAAARALGHCHEPAAIAALGTALEDPDPAMQHLAVTSLQQITGQNLGNEVDRWRQYVKSVSPKPLESPSLATGPTRAPAVQR